MLKDKKNITINITAGSFVKAFLFAIFLYVLYLVSDVVIVILLSVVIASGVEPAARWFQKRKIPRLPAVILTYLIAFSVLGTLFYMIIPAFFSDFTSFSSHLSAHLEKPLEWKFIGEYLPPSLVTSSGVFQDIGIKAAEYLNQFAGNIFQLIITVFGGAMSFVMIIVLSFYLSVQEKGIENFVRIITPIQNEKYIVDLWHRASKKIGLWLQGQILLGAIVAVLAFLGLTILQVEYALAFALLAGVFELIPVFGPVLSAVPPIITASFVSPMLAVAVTILYIVIQQLENHLIYPVVVRKIVGIPPIIVIIALIVGGKLGGFLGIILAVPFATVITLILQDIDLKKHPTMEELV